MGLIRKKLTVAFEADGRGHIRLADKHILALYDGSKMTSWSVPSLGELFSPATGRPRRIWTIIHPNFAAIFLRSRIKY